MTDRDLRGPTPHICTLRGKRENDSLIYYTVYLYTYNNGEKEKKISLVKKESLTVLSPLNKAPNCDFSGLDLDSLRERRLIVKFKGRVQQQSTPVL